MEASEEDTSSVLSGFEDARSDHDELLAAALEEAMGSPAELGHVEASSVHGPQLTSTPPPASKAVEESSEMTSEAELREEHAPGLGSSPNEGGSRPTSTSPLPDSASSESFPAIPTELATEREDDVEQSHTADVDMDAGVTGGGAGEGSIEDAESFNPHIDEDPGFAGPDGTWISRRKRDRDEADEVEDSKKDANLATACKESGNRLFAHQQFTEAMDCYTEALKYVPRGPEYDEARAVYFCNRAACSAGLFKWADTLYDCDRALEHNPLYIKAIARRAIALEKLERFDEAQKDLEDWLALEPNSSRCKFELNRLKTSVAERNEKLKDEMLGKLKDLGNTILGKFGLSLDNFKAVKDPQTGSYSISFEK